MLNDLAKIQRELNRPRCRVCGRSMRTMQGCEHKRRLQDQILKWCDLIVKATPSMKTSVLTCLTDHPCFWHQRTSGTKEIEMKKRRITSERARDLKAIRDVERWLSEGNSPREPGGGFKRVIDLLNAVSRVTVLAKEAARRPPGGGRA